MRALVFKQGGMSLWVVAGKAKMIFFGPRLQGGHEISSSTELISKLTESNCRSQIACSDEVIDVVYGQDFCGLSIILIDRIAALITSVAMMTTPLHQRRFRRDGFTARRGAEQRFSPVLFGWSEAGQKHPSRRRRVSPGVSLENTK